MLSAEQVKKLLPSGHYTDEQIEEIRDSIYQLATIMVNDYVAQKEQKMVGC